MVRLSFADLMLINWMLNGLPLRIANNRRSKKSIEHHKVWNATMVKGSKFLTHGCYFDPPKSKNLGACQRKKRPEKSKRFIKSVWCT